MKFLVVLAAFIAIAAAGTITTLHEVPTVLRQTNENHADGSYTNTLEQSDGITLTQTGTLRQVTGAETPVVVVQGTYGWTGPDNVKYVVNYVADENGFQADGTHLPVPV